MCSRHYRTQKSQLIIYLKSFIKEREREKKDYFFHTLLFITKKILLIEKKK